jgi:hypothetical protein
MPTNVALISESGAQRASGIIGVDENRLILLAGAVILFGAVVWSSSTPLREKTDFTITYVGLTILHQHDPAKLYDLNHQAAVRDSLFKNPNPLMFQHPPFEALILEPLAALPYKTAYLVWGLLNALLWLALPWIFRPYAPAPAEPLGYYALWFLFPPLGIALFMGQPSLLLLFLYTLTFIALKRGLDWRAGIYLGFGLFKFQFVLPFALILLVRRKWRFLSGFVCTATVLGILSLVAIGWKGIIAYVRFLFSIAAHPNNLSYGEVTAMGTLKGFVQLVLGHTLSPASLNIAVAALSLFLIALTGWYWLQLDRRNATESSDLMFAAALAVSLVTGFHMFSHDMSPLILGLFLVLAHLPGRDKPALRFVAAITLVLLWMPLLYFWLISSYLTCLMFPILALFGAVAFYLAVQFGKAAPNNQLAEAS